MCSLAINLKISAVLGKLLAEGDIFTPALTEAEVGGNNTATTPLIRVWSLVKCMTVCSVEGAQLKEKNKR